MISKFKLIDLRRAPYNPRIMPPEEMHELKENIKRHGFIHPMVINGSMERYGMIIAGHQRLTAIEQLLAIGFIPENIFKDEMGDYCTMAVVVNIPDIKEEQALNIAMNKISGDFVEDQLYNLLVNLKDSPALGHTGFSSDSIAGILDQNEQTVTTQKKTTEVDRCSRCFDLKLQVTGHAHRSGHAVELIDHANDK